MCDKHLNFYGVPNKSKPRNTSYIAERTAFQDISENQVDSPLKKPVQIPIWLVPTQNPFPGTPFSPNSWAAQIFVHPLGWDKQELDLHQDPSENLESWQLWVLCCDFNLVSTCLLNTTTINSSILITEKTCSAMRACAMHWNAALNFSEQLHQIIFCNLS